VRSLLLSCDLPAARVNLALAPGRMSLTPSNAIVEPEDELVLSLSPAGRSKLYSELARSAANSQFIRFPFCYPKMSFETCFNDSGVSPAVAELTRKLLYLHGDTQCFSDYEFLLRHIRSESERLA